MTKRVSAAEAKAHLSELVAKVAYGGERFVIERRGKPLAALVSLDDFERLGEMPKTAHQMSGFLSWVGAWGDVLSDGEIDEMTAAIYADRERDYPRPFELDLD